MPIGGRDEAGSGLGRLQQAFTAAEQGTHVVMTRSRRRRTTVQDFRSQRRGLTTMPSDAGVVSEQRHQEENA